MNSVTLNTLEAKIVNYLLGIHTKMDVISFITSGMENVDPDKGITHNWREYPHFDMWGMNRLFLINTCKP